MKSTFGNNTSCSLCAKARYSSTVKGNSNSSEIDIKHQILPWFTNLCPIYKNVHVYR